MGIRAVLISALALASCATLPPECRIPGARPMHCPLYKAPPPRACTPIYIDREYRGCVDRNEILRGVDQILRWVYD